MRRIAEMSLVVALTAFCAVSAMGAPAFERVAPEDTVGFFAIRSVPELKASYEGSNAQALFNETSMQAFLEAPKARLKELLAEQEGKAGVTLEEISGMLKGQIAVMAWGDGLEGSDNVGVIGLIEVGDQGNRAMEIVQAICNSLAMELEEGPLTFVEETYGNARILSVRPNVEQGMEFDEEDAFLFGLSGDVLMVGGPMAAMKRTVDSLAAQPAVSLAESESYKSVLQKISPESSVYGFLSIGKLFTTIRNGVKDEMDPNGLAQFDNAIQALGLDGVDAIGMSYRTEDVYGIISTFIKVNGEPRGLAKILMPAPGELHTGENIPANADTFYSVRFDPAFIWDEVQRIIAGISPEAMTAVNAQLDQLGAQAGEQFNLRNDLLSVFGPRLAFYSWYEKPYTLTSGQRIVLSLDITSKAAFESVFQKLQRIFPEQLSMFQKEDYMGQSFYKFGMPDMPEMEGMAPPEMPEMPAFAVTEKEFVFGVKAGDVQTHLRGLGEQGQSLASLPAFQEAMKTIPAEGRIAYFYSDGKNSIDYLMTILREGQLDMIIGMLASDPDVAEFVNLFDFTKLPPSEDVIKHISPSAGTVLVQPEGLMIIQKGRVRQTPQ